MTPQTEAGRYLRDRLRVIHSLSSSDIDKDILAIEREAAVTAIERVRAEWRSSKQTESALLAILDAEAQP